MREDRKPVLLRAALDILQNIEQSQHADALGVTAIWDDAHCDGYCLIAELRCELETEEGET